MLFRHEHTNRVFTSSGKIINQSSGGAFKPTRYLRAAASVAAALVRADADGIPSHGVARLPIYADQSKCAKVDGFAKPDLSETGTAAIRVDARCGFAFPAIDLGLARAMEMVETAVILNQAELLERDVDRLAGEGDVSVESERLDAIRREVVRVSEILARLGKIAEGDPYETVEYQGPARMIDLKVELPKQPKSASFFTVQGQDSAATGAAES